MTTGMQRVWALTLLPLAAATGSARADDNVEWSGVSHIAWLDLRPICPVGGEAFEVRFQTYRDDITSARVRATAASAQWIDAAVIEQRGPYDVWAAQLPATASAIVSYLVELTDGSDTDYLSAAGMTEALPAGGEFIVDFSTLSHAPLGATPAAGGGTVFRVWSPATGAASVRGQFNGWGTTPMSRLGEDWVAYVPAAQAGQQYKFYFNNSVWNTDPRARSLAPASSYNAVVRDPVSYQWRSGGFRTPPREQIVIYQLHVGTFAGRNDPLGPTPNPSRFIDVANRAEHLAQLGVNAVMFNPWTEFPGDFSGGYNPVSAWAVESRWGTADDLKNMVDTLHEHGIAVLLDAVWNHVSPTDNFLWNYDGSQVYFDSPAVQTPWGAQLDFDRGPVRQYVQQAAINWIEEFRLDGFRVDGTDFMNIPPQEGAGWSLMQWINDSIDNRAIDKIVIAEQLPDDPWVTRPTSLGGAGFDAQYHDAFTDRLREELFDAAFGDPEMWKVRDVINGSGEYLFGSKVVNYLELHDEAWPSSGGQRFVVTVDPTAPHDSHWAKGRSKLGQGIVLTAPGIPAILQGTEWLESEGFGGGSPSGQDRIDWSKKVTYSGIFAYYRDLIALRTGSPALRADSPWQVFHLNDADNVIAYQRWTNEGDVIVVVASFNNSDRLGYRIGLPQPGSWHEAVNSQSAQYEGSGVVNPGTLIADAAVPYDGMGQSITLDIAQMGLIVLRWGVPPPGPCPGDFNGDGNRDTADFFEFFAGFFAAPPAADYNADGVTDTSDFFEFFADFFGPPCQ